MTISMISGNCRNYFASQESEDTPIQHIECWRIEDKEICLLRKGEQLSYEVLDTINGTTTKGSIHLEGHPIKDMIAYLLECIPRVIENGSVNFYPRPELPYIHRWILGNHEIYLRRKGNRLKYKLLNNLKGSSTSGPIPFNERLSIEGVIVYLSKCQPEVSETGTVNFVPKPLTHHTWTFRNKEVKLLQKNRSLIWELFDKSTKTSSQTPIDEGFLDWELLFDLFDCSKSEPFSIAEYLEKYAKKNNRLSLLELFRDCEIEKIDLETTPQTSIKRLKAIYAKKIVGKSILNPSVAIDDSRWAVTLINSGKTSLDPTTWAGHAAIIIEGREDGAFFKHKAHLKQKEGVILISGDGFFYSDKGETWQVHPYAVKKMLDSVKWDIGQQQAGNSKVIFRLGGNKSKLSRAHIINEYSSLEDVIRNALGPECIDSSLASPAPAPFKSIILRNREGKQWTQTNERFATLAQMDFFQRLFIQNQNDDGWKEVIEPHNCMTYAREKLRYCGIYLKSKRFDHLLAAPKGYMSQGLGSLKNILNTDYQQFRRRMYAPEEKAYLVSLISAIKEGAIHEVENLLNQEIDLTQKNEKGYNALHMACKRGNIWIVELLLNKKMNINQPSSDADRSTPLLLAIKKRNLDLIKFLLESGASANQKDNQTGETLLHFLANSPYFTRNMKIPEVLIGYEVNINEKNFSGDTALIITVKNKKWRMARLFLQNKANVNQKDSVNKPPLWYACINNDEKMVSLLLEYNPDLIAAYPQNLSENIRVMIINALEKRIGELEKIKIPNPMLTTPIISMWLRVSWINFSKEEFARTIQSKLNTLRTQLKELELLSETEESLSFRKKLEDAASRD